MRQRRGGRGGGNIAPRDDHLNRLNVKQMIYGIYQDISQKKQMYGNVKTKWCISGKVEESLKMDLVKEF